MLDRLPTLCLLSPGQKISYAEAKAFHNVLRDMTLIERLIQDGAFPLGPLVAKAREKANFEPSSTCSRRSQQRWKD